MICKFQILCAVAFLSVFPLKGETWYWVGQMVTPDAKGNQYYYYSTPANWTNATGS